MASYLPGVQDYIPKAQPFTPDFNYYSNILSFKQAKYDAGYEQLNTIYSSKLNGPMSRTDNKEDRDKFFKVIKNDITKMAGLDLSKSQNVVAAGNVFNQLLDNDYIAKDMAWTKNLQTQQRRGQMLKGCSDPAKCGGQWWEGGDKQLQYKAMEFKNSSRDETLNARNVEYVPYQDVQMRAIELADKLDLKVTAPVKDDGRFIITQTNGTLIQGDLYNMFMSSLGQDPKIKAYNTTRAYNQRMAFSTSNAEKYGSLDKANSQYLNNYYEKIAKQIEEETSKAESKLRNSESVAKQKKKQLDDEPENASPGLKKLYNELESAWKIDSDNYSIYKKEKIKSKNIGTIPNLNVKLSMLDELVGSSIFDSEMKSAAITLSKRNASIKRDVNPYGLATYKSQLADANAKRAEERKEKKEEEKAKKENGDGTNGFRKVATDALGGEGKPDEHNRGSRFRTIANHSKSLQDKIIGTEKASIRDYYKATLNAANRGDEQAIPKLIELGDSYMNNLSGKQNRSTPGAEEIEEYNRMNPADKQQYWANNKMYIQSSEIGDGFYNEVFEDQIKTSMERNKSNDSDLSYLGSFTKNNQSRLNAINANLSLDKELSEDIKNVVSKVRAEVMQTGETNMEAFDMLYDEYGARRSKEDFKKLYITDERVAGLREESKTPFNRGHLNKNTLWNYASTVGSMINAPLIQGAKALGFVGETEAEEDASYREYLEKEVDDFYSDQTENLSFREDGESGKGGAGADYDSWDREDIRDVFDELFDKHDIDGRANKSFDFGDTAFITSMISGVADVAHPGTESMKYVNEFLEESDNNRATNYFIPKFSDSDGFVTNKDDNNELAESLVKQIYSDFITDEGKANSATRTKIRYEYSPILDGDEGYQYLRIYPSQKYLSSIAGTSGTKPLDETTYGDIASNGIVIAYPTAGSRNTFLEKSSETPEEYMLEKNDYFNLDLNQQYDKDMTITKLDDGSGFNVKGFSISGVENGEPKYDLSDMNYGNEFTLNSLIKYYQTERLEKLKKSYASGINQ